jgi:hypothetical protein
VKHILDSSFRYKPSFDADVGKTFQRIRRQLHEAPGELKPQSRDDGSHASANIGLYVDRDRLLRRL